MTIAWFRAAEPGAAPPPDDITAVMDGLRATHAVRVFTAASAHDFVWMHFRTPFDLCVHEIDASPASAFIWAYARHYGGVLVLRAPSMPAGPAGRLRDAVLAARLVVVPYGAAAAALEAEGPDVRVRVVPGCAPAPIDEPPEARRGPESPVRPIRFGVTADGCPASVRRALDRARAGGAHADLVAGAAAADTVRDGDVVLALRWPSFTDAEPLALGAMAAGKPVVVFETEATADWPALDPQTWRPRGRTADAPIAISVDPRDEEHSILLALRRLSTDAALRDELGAAARRWWRANASVDQCVARWTRVVEEAAAIPPPPSHAADGSERAREILGEMGVTVDFL